MGATAWTRWRPQGSRSISRVTPRYGAGLFIDGHYQLNMSQAFVPVGEPLFPLSEVDPCEFVLSANVHRRHLTAEQKRELIAKVLKAQPEKSNRQVAEQVKASITPSERYAPSYNQLGKLPSWRGPSVRTVRRALRSPSAVASSPVWRRTPMPSAGPISRNARPGDARSTEAGILRGHDLGMRQRPRRHQPSPARCRLSCRRHGP